MHSPFATGSPRDRLAFALDVPDLGTARRWLDRLAPEVGVFKVGLELFLAAGAPAVAAVHAAGARCFLDLKLHDIPETVARAVTVAGASGADLLTLHASGGGAMIARAREHADRCTRPPLLLAVTVLTSLDDAALAAIGFVGTSAHVAHTLAGVAIGAGAQGLVCSPHEVAALRFAFPNALLVTPGIRATGSARGDQSRVATASDAIRAGADLLVVGRPVRDASDPVAAARALVAEIAQAAS